MKAHVWVMPKRTVLDPQGQTIQHALSGLGYSAVKDVRQGKFFVLNLDGWSREEAPKTCSPIRSSKNTALKLSIDPSFS
jgi:phosphoribosylformylglycinamidine synthase